MKSESEIKALIPELYSKLNRLPNRNAETENNEDVEKDSNLWNLNKCKTVFFTWTRNLF